MNATKRAQVPFGLRKKLMAATSMLLVAAIMLVSTSYAWFTLSTAPEITGITTSVGANGNLEIALLTSETFENMSLITSNAGDSMEASGQSKVAANATWGNLVDLDDPSYGLTSALFKLYPSALNWENGILKTSPLATPNYGADGRVTELDGTRTTSATFKDAAFTVDTAAANNGYGVRAVGAASNVSPRQLAFNSAKSGATMNANNAYTYTKNAVANNADVLMGLALAGGTPTSYSYDEVAAMKAIAVGVQSSLNSVVKTYANTIAAYALSGDCGLEDTAAIAAANAVSGKTDANEVINAIAAGVTGTEIDEIKTELNALAAAQAKVATAISTATTMLEANTGKAAFTASSNFSGGDDLAAVEDNVATPLIGGTADMEAYDASDAPITGSLKDNATNIKKLYMTGDTAVATVADYTGTFQVIKVSFPEITVYAGEKGATTGKLAAVTNIVGSLNSPSDAATAALSEFYGYIIDFAFRTNAAGSSLKLQSEAANRVYSDATDNTLATMGQGSTATLTYDTTGLTAAQGKRLLEAMRVVFFNPTTSEVFGFGQFTVTENTAVSTTGTLKLYTGVDASVTKYVLGKTAYELSYALDTATYPAADGATVAYANEYKTTLTASEYEAFTPAATSSVVEDGLTTYTLGKDAYNEVYTIKADFTVATDTAPSADNCTNYNPTITKAAYELLGAETGTRVVNGISYTESTDDVLTELPQNEPTKVSAMVYMDGTKIDNSAVSAMGESGTLSLNLQFSSTADLVPMENSALKNQTAE